jgi:prepilin-type N-terminal cleavage/methylation domain-containing protein
MMQTKKSQRGFTIIELLIATAVFSLVLIIFLTALIRISQLFYKGVNLANTQEATRNAIQTISDDIQFSGAAPNVHPDFFCIGGYRYSINKGVQVTGASNNFALIREVSSQCQPWQGPMSVAPDFSKAEKLLDPGMQVNDLTITPLNGGWQIKLLVVYYGSDSNVFYSPSNFTPAFQAPDARCTGLPSSSQFCATADYQTTILQKF